jgi:hypothetical protein
VPQESEHDLAAEVMTSAAAAPPTAPPPSAPQPPEAMPLPPSLDAAVATSAAAVPTTAEVSAPFAPPPAVAPVVISELERGMALRFIAEVMAAQIARLPDDPVARRGAALFITGAIRQLAAVAGMSLAAEVELATLALAQALPRHAVDAFFSQFNAHIQATQNQVMIDAGRKAMASFVAGQPVEPPLSQCLGIWRVPTMQPMTTPPAVVNHPPSEIYLMTEWRGGDATPMDLHNRIVRVELETADGHEIKHTGRGILARFQEAGAAVRAAFALIDHLRLECPGEQAPPCAVALVGGFGVGDDPLHSPSITNQANAMLTGVAKGTVVCKPSVYQACGAIPGLTSRRQGDDDIILSLNPGPAALLIVA